MHQSRGMLVKKQSNYVDFDRPISVATYSARSKVFVVSLDSGFVMFGFTVNIPFIAELFFSRGAVRVWMVKLRND